MADIETNDNQSQCNTLTVESKASNKIIKTIISLFLAQLISLCGAGFSKSAMPFSRLHESASPPGDFLVVRWPNGALSPHRIDDPAFCDANFIDRREGAIPFRQNMRHENQPYSCDAIKRYLTFDEAEQFIKTTLTPIQTSFQSMLIPATQPSRSHVFRPMASSASQPSLAFVPMHPTSPPAFHNQVSISMPQSPQHQPLTPMTPSPQGSNSLVRLKDYE
uniref:Uncharacterized protein n=1 Tax=Panagrellus redivivus TaxID=6233 RepID=A0A7E4W4E0_PANRE